MTLPSAASESEHVAESSSADGEPRPRPHVLHVAEAAAGGVLRHVELVLPELVGKGLEVSAVLSPLRDSRHARVVAETLRMGGHATHDEVQGRQILPESTYQHWGKRDPVGVYEEYLVATGACQRGDLEAVEATIVAEVEAAAEAALASRETSQHHGPEALEGVYADS